MRKTILYTASIIILFFGGYYWKPISLFFLDFNSIVGLMLIIIGIQGIMIRNLKEDIDSWRNSYNELENEKSNSRSAAYQINQLKKYFSNKQKPKKIIKRKNKKR